MRIRFPSNLQTTSRHKWRASLPRAARLLPCALLLAGCAQHTVYEYTPIALDMDGASELHVSTYPAGFPREQSHIPFLYKSLHSPQAVYLQVFVRDRVKQFGPNRHIRSIRIDEFSVQIGNGPPLKAIQDYDANFWMQDNPQQSALREPLPFVPGSQLSISARITLNGQDYRLSGTMPAHTRTSSFPLILLALR